jgi:NmrA-like family
MLFPIVCSPNGQRYSKRSMKGVYSVQDFWTVGARREVLQGENMADAARSAGVEHLLYSSVGGAERNSGITHWETKGEVENLHSRARPASHRPSACGVHGELFILQRSKSEFLKEDWRIRFAVTKRIRQSRLTTSAPSERWLLIGPMILSVSSWKLREASSPTFKRRKRSVARWGNELNFRRSPCRSSVSSGKRILLDVSLVRRSGISGRHSSCETAFS